VLRLPSKGRSTYSPVRLVKQYKKKYKNDEMIKYQVRRNDNLTKIASRFNTEVSHLVRLNKIKYPNQINPGRILRVPFKVKASSNIRKLTSLPRIAKFNKNQPQQKYTNSEKLRTENHKIKLAHIKSVDQANQVRPAFLPVSFSSRNNTVNPSQVGVIVVDFDETLSHYAEWSKLPVKQLMKLNSMTKRSQLNIHSKIKVPFLKIKPDIFEVKRQEFHKAIQEDFFNNFKIDKLLVRNILKGETVWEICNEIYSIPFWLLASYNPGKNISSIPIGDPIVIPLISPSKSSS
jgi:membrane-bound lytic murein transglycosylase D